MTAKATDGIMCARAEQPEIRPLRRTRRAAATRRFAALSLAITLISALLTGSASGSPAGLGARPNASSSPKVTQQPSSVTVAEGGAASFSASASNSPAVQWELSTDGGASWHPIEGATATTYAIAASTLPESGHEFRAVFTNSSGSATSRAATLTVTAKPTVTQQPADATVAEGHEATFEARASGAPTPTVQWQYSTDGGSTFKTVRGATSDVLHLTSVHSVENETRFRALFKNSTGETLTSLATLFVVDAPTVSTQPASTSVVEGSSAKFESYGGGNPSPTEQWEVSTDGGTSWAAIAGANSPMLTIPATTSSENGNEYRAAYSNVAGSATSAAATLTVLGRPVVTLQPESATVLVGATASFEAAAVGNPSPTVQWEMSSDQGSSWTPISEATSDSLTVPTASLSENGHEYRAAFRNSVGTTPSQAATLTVASNDYRAYGWGLNSRGQAGDGTNETIVASPMPISGAHFVTAVAGGSRFSLALLAGGTVDAWGYNGDGQFGFERPDSNTPVPVPHVTGVKAIAAGANHSVALLANGSVEDWGDNESGQLGNGGKAESAPPVIVEGLSGVTAVAAGSEHTLALLANGTVMAWGNNERGQLGNGSTKESDTPAPVKGLGGVTAIAANRNFSLALLSNGTVMAWGDDEHGQLGNAEVIETSQEEGRFARTPVLVEGLSGVTAIAAGQTHALALLSGGTVVAWGDDREGELGDGRIEAMSLHPTAVSGLTNVVSIAAGETDSAAILESGALMTWGANNVGSLGLGTHGEAVDTPTRVSALGMVAGVAAGGSQMIAFGEALPTVTGVSPASGPSSGGTEVTITGTNIAAASAVHFGTAAASSFRVESATTVSAVAPAGAGTVDVTVTAAAGTTPASGADRYTYVARPAVTKLSAKGGPASGGTTVLITGTSLAGATEVRFGEAAAAITADSPTSITVLSPKNVSGQVLVTVTTTGGSSATNGKTGFKYAPSIESVAPPGGPLAGGTSVLISGAGFAPGAGMTKFKFGSASSKSVQCASTTSCTVIVPATSASGAVAVVATANNAHSAPSEGARYTYE